VSVGIQLRLGANAGGCATNRMYVSQPVAAGSTPVAASNLNTFNVNFCGSAAGLTYGSLDFVFRGTTAIKGFTFWIDLNQDGDFDDPDEMIEQRPTQAATNFGDYWIWANSATQGVYGGCFPPVVVPPQVANGITKMRVISYNNPLPGFVVNDPCYGSNVSITHDFDVNIICGGSEPLFPSDVNVCNVDMVTSSSARVSCFDKNGTPANLKFHYKIIRHD
jgi:hypothetical protein